MSANTGDTEVETLETPTPPQNGRTAAPASISTPDRNQREDAIEEDSDENNSRIMVPPSESETERSGRYIYHDDSELTYTDESDLFSGDIECCVSLTPKCWRQNESESESENSNNLRIQDFITSLISQIYIIGFISFSILWLIIGYLLPSCFCSDLFGHIVGLPISLKLLVFVLLLFFTFLGWLSVVVNKSLRRKASQGIFSMLILMIFFILGSVVGNSYLIYKSGGWNNYQIYNEEFYTKAGQSFIQEDFIKSVKVFAQFSESKSVAEIFQRLFYKRGLSQIEAIERVFKWYFIGGWFLFNIFLMIVVRNIVKYRQMYYNEVFDDFDDDRSVASRRSRTSQKSRQSRISKSSKKSRKMSRDRPPSYGHISPPKSDYTVNTVNTHRTHRTQNGTIKSKMRNFNHSFAPPMSEYSNPPNYPNQYLQPHSGYSATLGRTMDSRDRTMDSRDSRRISLVHDRHENTYQPYGTIQKRRPKNQEDFLY